jgi:hypothetical protein
MQFVWLRCHRKIKHRLVADEVILGIPLPVLLDKWNLADSDVVEENWHLVNLRMYSIFDSLNIPFRLEGTTRKYQFSRSTIPAWCKLFISTIRYLKELAVRSDMELTSITELNTTFFTLNYLLYDNRAFETLLALPSLENEINDAIKTAAGRLRGERPGE